MTDDLLLSDDGIRRLAAAVLLRAIDDYRAACRMEKALYQLQVHFSFADSRAELHRFLDGMALVYCDAAGIEHAALEGAFRALYRGSALQRWEREQAEQRRHDDEVAQIKATAQTSPPRKRTHAEDAEVARAWRRYYRTKGGATE